MLQQHLNSRTCHSCPLVACVGRYCRLPLQNACEEVLSAGLACCSMSLASLRESPWAAQDPGTADSEGGSSHEYQCPCLKVNGKDVLQGSDVSSVSTAASMPQPAAGAPGSVRKKRITRRVGYARDADDEEPLPKTRQPAAPGESLSWRLSPLQSSLSSLACRAWTSCTDLQISLHLTVQSYMHSFWMGRVVPDGVVLHSLCRSQHAGSLSGEQPGSCSKASCSRFHAAAGQSGSARTGAATITCTLRRARARSIQRGLSGPVR